MFPDFKELLSEFNARQVKYLVVGGYAMAFHGRPRATKDLDIVISADAENGRALYAALAKFGAPLAGLKPQDLIEPGHFFRMGTPPVMVDILPSIAGVDFQEAWKRHIDVPIDDTLTVPVISRPDLLTAKIAAGRPQDLADAVALAEIQKQYDQAEKLSSASRAKALESIDEMQRKARERWLKRQAGHSAASAAGKAKQKSRRMEHDLDDDEGS